MPRQRIDCSWTDQASSPASSICLSSLLLPTPDTSAQLRKDLYVLRWPTCLRKNVVFVMTWCDDCKADVIKPQSDYSRFHSDKQSDWSQVTRPQRRPEVAQITRYTPIVASNNIEEYDSLSDTRINNAHQTFNICRAGSTVYNVGLFKRFRNVVTYRKTYLSLI